MQLKKIKLYLKNNQILEGILMEKTSYNKEDSIIIKLASGYNIAISEKDVDKIEELELLPKKPETKEHVVEKKSKEKILIIGTGGTIASKVEYTTGGVKALTTSEELIENIPEIKSLPISIEATTIMNEMSENLTPKDWEAIAQKTLDAYEEHKSNLKGIILTHGTDTLHYTSAALAYTLASKIDVPLVLVGSQRSSDRPSSDAYLNLLGAINFILKTKNKQGVYVLMHKDVSDEEFAIILGTRARKLHTSRRDAFKSINKELAGILKYDLETKEWSLKENLYSYQKTNDLEPIFSENVALIKYYPGMKPELLKYILEHHEGIIIEGTGLGHINVKDSELLNLLKEHSSKKFIGMVSQTIYGSTHLYVYQNLRILSSLGIVYLKDMSAEAAYVKLSLLLGNKKPIKEIKELMLQPFFYEIDETEQLWENL